MKQLFSVRFFNGCSVEKFADDYKWIEVIVKAKTETRAVEKARVVLANRFPSFAASEFMATPYCRVFAPGVGGMIFCSNPTLVISGLKHKSIDIFGVVNTETDHGD